MSITDKLLTLKEKIEDAKTEKAQLEGKLETLTEQLKNDFDCSSIEEAKKLIEKLQGELENKQTEIEKGMDKLEKDYEW